MPPDVPDAQLGATLKTPTSPPVPPAGSDSACAAKLFYYPQYVWFKSGDLLDWRLAANIQVFYH